jgi:hypothetical protein
LSRREHDQRAQHRFALAVSTAFASSSDS